MTSPKENPIRKTKFFFQFNLKDFLNSHWVWTVL